MRSIRSRYPGAVAVAALLAMAGRSGAAGLPVPPRPPGPAVQVPAPAVQHPSAAPAQPSHPAPADKIPPVPGLYGVLNFTSVDAAFACGGAPSEGSMAALRQAGFVTVVNLRAAGERGSDVEAEAEAARAAGLRYVHLPFVAASPDPAVVDEFLRVVSDPANQPVLLHCASGTRASILWAIKRVVQDGWSVERAMGELPQASRAHEPLKAFALQYIHEHAKQR